MGDLFHLFDSDNRSMARKVFSHRKHVDGLEAPRNSLELRIENSQSYSSARELPVAEEDWSAKNRHPFEASMKKLINEEISKNPSARQSAPSIVARLMGMDYSAASDPKPVVRPIEKRNESSRAKYLNKDRSTGHVSCDSSSSCPRQKPRSREHPQEEELQRFKKEFEAWQAARFRECSKFADPELYEKPAKSEEFERFSAPTRIVILKPGPDRVVSNDYKDSSWSSSPSSLDQRSGSNSIEDFLEEVRERLKCEMQGKILLRKGGSVARGSGIETPYSEKPSDPKQIARGIAQRARENAGLARSESTRSYRSEVKFVAKRETGHSRSYSVLDLDRAEERKTRTRSFRHGAGESDAPRGLIRSLSAPVSGTSFGKLLLEDRHVLTGAQIRRKLEGTENALDEKKRKKEKPNFKERVSSFRYSFSLRSRIFGKKIPPAIEPRVYEHFPLKDIASGPTVVSNFGERHENFTEVPPSPASVCSSSAQDEFWKPIDRLLSPQLSPDTTPPSAHALPQAFREISSNLIELRRQLNQLESVEPPEEEEPEEESDSVSVTDKLELIKDPSEAYVRDLLVASGLYDSSDKFMSKWETLSKPVSFAVFREVEECYEKLSSSSSSAKDNHRKLLHDLLNESLSTVLNSSSSVQRRGKELLRCVWEVMSQHLNRSSSSVNLVDDLVARDLRSRHRWSGAMDNIIVDLGREIESLIIGDLVDEILFDKHR